MFSHLDHLECTQCGQTYSPTQLIGVSPCCGKVLFARCYLPRLRGELDRDALSSRPADMWLYGLANSWQEE